MVSVVFFTIILAVFLIKVLCSYQVTALSKFALLRYLSEIRFQVLDSDLSAIYP